MSEHIEEPRSMDVFARLLPPVQPVVYPEGACPERFFLTVDQALAPELEERTKPARFHERDGSWVAVVPDEVGGPGIFVKGLRPRTHPFLQATLKDRHDALMQERMRFLLSRNIVPPYSVELADVVCDEQAGYIRFGAVTAEPPAPLWGDLFGPDDCQHLDQNKEWAIVMRYVPGGGVENYVESLGQADLQNLQRFGANAIAAACATESVRSIRKRLLECQPEDFLDIPPYFKIEVHHLKTLYHNELGWNRGRVAAWLREWEAEVGPADRPAVQYLQSIDMAYEDFVKEMLEPGGFIYDRLKGVYVRYAGNTPGDTHLGNIVRFPHGQFMLIDFIGKINDPDYSELYYKQEDLADLGLFIADIEAHMLRMGLLPNDMLADQLIVDYLRALRLHMDLQIPPAMAQDNVVYQAPSGNRATWTEMDYMVAPDLAKLHYYCAIKARMLAISAVVANDRKDKAVYDLLVCDAHMRRARELNARYKGFKLPLIW